MNADDVRRMADKMRNADADFVRSCTLSGLPIIPGPVLLPTMIVPEKMFERIKGMLPRAGEKSDG